MIDTHCHLNDPEKFPDPDLELAEGRALGLTGAVVIGVDQASSRRAVEIAERHVDVWAVVGHHPNYAALFDPDALNLYRELAHHPKTVAIGEIGLDFYWDFATADQQTAALEPLYELAREAQLPIVFHCREAYAALVDWLSARPVHPCVFHCFAGDADQAQWILARGGYLGVDGPITYKKSEGLRSMAIDWPRDQVLMETDAPYLSPVPYRGQPNRPAFVKYVNQTLAELWDLRPEACEQQLDANARTFFRLPTVGPKES